MLYFCCTQLLRQLHLQNNVVRIKDSRNWCWATDPLYTQLLPGCRLQSSLGSAQSWFTCEQDHQLYCLGPFSWFLWRWISLYSYASFLKVKHCSCASLNNPNTTPAMKCLTTMPSFSYEQLPLNFHLILIFWFGKCSLATLGSGLGSGISPMLLWWSED